MLAEVSQGKTKSQNHASRALTKPDLEISKRTFYRYVQGAVIYARGLTKVCIFVLGSDISNNCQIWHDGGMDQHFLNESSNGPNQPLDVPALSPMRTPGVSDSYSQMCSRCHCPIQRVCFSFNFILGVFQLAEVNLSAVGGS